jgi:hypothetical protein
MKLVNVLAVFVLVAATYLFRAETRRGAIAIAIQRGVELSTQRKPSREATLPLIQWVHGIETAPALKQTGIEEIAVPSAKLEEWRRAGFNAHALSEQHLKQRERVLLPRVGGRVNVASATRRPWIDSNGWRFMRKPTGKFYYDVTERGAGSATLAIAESFAYQADAILKIDQTDLAAAGRMLVFLRSLPQASLPIIADIGLIDDGSAATGEVMNLLTRRNLLFRIVSAPSPELRVNIKLGSKDYPRADASDPSAFALKVRRQLGDENRSLRIFGSEIVISRLTGDGKRVHLHLLNYSGRELDGLRVRLRGKYAKGELNAFGVEQVGFEDFVVADDATEFTIPKLSVYALIELWSVR